MGHDVIALITGVAGFVGSTLAEECIKRGYQVRGIDSLTPYYDVQWKLRNLAGLNSMREFEFVHDDLVNADLRRLLQDVDVVFHQAGQPGVRRSWQAFSAYVHDNITATHVLLESMTESSCKKLVIASSSSVYGDSATYPVVESTELAPRSPYGVTKLAAEKLSVSYGFNSDIDVTALRYFTVFGPRQRPDMAMTRLVRSALTGAAFPLYGDGNQIRDFTFITDIVNANLAAAAARSEAPQIYNICGGGAVSLNEVISTIEDIVGRDVLLDRRPAQAGDVFRTGGSSARAESEIGWRPTADLKDGLSRQVEWLRGVLNA